MGRWRHRAATLALFVGLTAGVGCLFATLSAQYEPTDTAVKLAVLRNDVDNLTKQYDRLETIGSAIIVTVICNLVVAGLSLRKGR
jgi:hypothetical protein